MYIIFDNTEIGCYVYLREAFLLLRNVGYDKVTMLDKYATDDIVNKLAEEYDVEVTFSADVPDGSQKDIRIVATEEGVRKFLKGRVITESEGLIVDPYTTYHEAPDYKDGIKSMLSNGRKKPWQ